ncbi:helix-turn-helix domain-containing protein [Rhodococcus sp. ACT016]|uniref:helix-turn-helix domain-containing protein n=1 Tax=Rhodococcus sp. ACT016 TaxID=3134808 RepID=UPI003D2D49E2
MRCPQRVWVTNCDTCQPHKNSAGSWKDLPHDRDRLSSNGNPHGPSPTQARNNRTVIATTTSIPTSRRRSLLTAIELAERWQISSRTVYRLAQAGEISSIRIGDSVRFTEEAVQAYETAHTRKVGDPW